jgi:hypothetical protein
MLETVFSTWPVQMGYKENNWSKHRLAIVRNRYQATTSEDTADIKRLQVIWLSMELSDGAIIKCNYRWCVNVVNKSNIQPKPPSIDKLTLYRPWKPLGLREVEVPTFSDIRLTDGGKVVSPTRWSLFTPRKIPGTHFCYRLSRPHGHSVVGRIPASSTSSGTGTGDLPACNIVPQPTTLPRATKPRLQTL